MINSLTENFESHTNQTSEGVEFWMARDLQLLLEYKEWRNFNVVITKAKTACEVSEQQVDDHFVEVNKKVTIGSGSVREIKDIMLTRFACYLITQNGDPRKAELIEKKMLEHERVLAREKLKSTEKELSHVIYQQTGNIENFALIRSKGDHALFGKTTREMKDKWEVKNKPLADFMPTLLLKAKDFATEITIFNAKANNMETESQISNEHITNNSSVRDTLISRGIKPENISPEEDISKINRRLKSDDKNSLKNPKKLK